ncbi:MAG: glycosyltransferase family 4 protein [Pseudomonadota bacterium]
MKILLTHRYFWPDSPPYAAILRVIGEGLAEQGHEVHVFASMPSYRAEGTAAKAPKRERMGDLQVRRVWVLPEGSRNPVVRVLNVLIYMVGLFVHILRTRPDLVTASTFPPLAAGWSASLAARLIGAKFVYHMMDVHPEVSAHAGSRLGQGWLFRLQRWIDQGTLGRATSAVVLSEDMAETLAARPRGARCPIRVINNFALDAFEPALDPPQDLVKDPARIRVIFAGNLGRFQDLPLLADGIALLFERYPALEVFFLGDGVALPGLKDRWEDHPQVRFGPFLPFAQAKSLIAEADLGLVSLTPGVYRVAYPSKMLTYLGLGVPVLALVEPESALARSIADHGLGAVPAARTPEAIAAALDPLIADTAALARTRDQVQAYAKAEVDRTAILSQWQSLLEDITKGGDA